MIAEWMNWLRQAEQDRRDGYSAIGHGPLGPVECVRNQGQLFSIPPATVDAFGTTVPSTTSIFDWTRRDVRTWTGIALYNRIQVVLLPDPAAPLVAPPPCTVTIGGGPGFGDVHQTLTLDAGMGIILPLIGDRGGISLNNFGVGISPLCGAFLSTGQIPSRAQLTVDVGTILAGGAGVSVPRPAFAIDALPTAEGFQQAGVGVQLDVIEESDVATIGGPWGYTFNPNTRVPLVLRNETRFVRLINNDPAFNFTRAAVVWGFDLGSLGL